MSVVATMDREEYKQNMTEAKLTSFLEMRKIVRRELKRLTKDEIIREMHGEEVFSSFWSRGDFFTGKHLFLLDKTQSMEEMEKLVHKPTNEFDTFLFNRWIGNADALTVRLFAELMYLNVFQTGEVIIFLRGFYRFSGQYK